VEPYLAHVVEVALEVALRVAFLGFVVVELRAEAQRAGNLLEKWAAAVQAAVHITGKEEEEVVADDKGHCVSSFLLVASLAVERTQGKVRRVGLAVEEQTPEIAVVAAVVKAVSVVGLKMVGVVVVVVVAVVVVARTQVSVGGWAAVGEMLVELTGGRWTVVEDAMVGVVVA
jgi:hypothetical protein